MRRVTVAWKGQHAPEEFQCEEARHGVESRNLVMWRVHLGQTKVMDIMTIPLENLLWVREERW